MLKSFRIFKRRYQDHVKLDQMKLFKLTEMSPVIPSTQLNFKKKYVINNTYAVYSYRKKTYKHALKRVSSIKNS